jgi:hypothetical protein
LSDLSDKINLPTKERSPKMGLDMYLNGEMYVSKTDYTKYRETMDADKSVNNDYQIVTTLFDLDKYISKEAFAGLTIGFPVAYWRKSNQIHKWFVDNVQDGEDNCQKHIVYRDKIEQLKEVCINVIAVPEMAEELLPNGEGFFFGSQEYDEYYFGDLQTTVEMLNKALELPEMYDLYYESSW